jgi:trans-2,3-dihydro-3-hydroxyanthranilate isomerase
VSCRVEASTRDAVYARFDLPRLPEEASGTTKLGVIAAALGLKEDDIGFDGMAPSRWSAGHTFAFVPLRGLGAVQRSRADMGHWDAAFSGTTGAFVFCRETVDAGHAFHARMFAPSYGVPEDPATGSAVAALAGLLAHHISLTDGDHEFRIEQGYEMDRPSLITLGMTIKDRRLTAGSIGGHAVVVSEGTIDV